MWYIIAARLVTSINPKGLYSHRNTLHWIESSTWKHCLCRVIMHLFWWMRAGKDAAILYFKVAKAQVNDFYLSCNFSSILFINGENFNLAKKSKTYNLSKIYFKCSKGFYWTSFYQRLYNYIYIEKKKIGYSSWMLVGNFECCTLSGWCFCQ